MAFSPESLPGGKLFQVTIDGAFTYRGYFTEQSHTDSHSFYADGSADACYNARHTPSFGERYYGLWFDGKRAPEPIREERWRHRYCFAYEGRGERLSILLKLSQEYRPTDLQGTLEVTIGPLPPEGAAILQEREETALDWQKLLLAERRREKEEEEERQRQREEEQRQTRLRELALCYEYADYYERDEWLKGHAKKYCAELRAERENILARSRTLHQDTAFIEFLKREAPHIYTRALWEVRALAFADQCDVEEAQARPKETRQEYHERRLRNFLTSLSQRVSFEEATREFIEGQLSGVEEEEEREQLREELQRAAAQIWGQMNTKRSDAGDGKVLGRK